jgi:acetyl-CoA carboxylase carboxyl transferase subunit alpha
MKGSQATYALEFEKPLLELEQKLAELKRHAATGTGPGDTGALDVEIRRLERRCMKLQEEIFNDLSRWQVVQLSRHPNRPYMLDYIQRLFTDWIELHGDRSFADDQALIGGVARFDGEPVVVIGQQKGRSTKENILRSFGMPRPEGYRKALRLMKLAERFDRPVIAFIDTPGAYPGIDAEERGQAEAIAVCLEEMAALPVPVISVVIGEGGSGGALAIGVCNRLLMLQYSWYSVISPESCAAILYRDASKGERAAEALKLTARDAFELGIVDQLVDEAPGGAHRDPDLTAHNLGAALRRHLRDLRMMDPEGVVDDRYAKFRYLGPVTGPDMPASSARSPASFSRPPPAD